MTSTNTIKITEFRWKLNDIVDRLNEGQIYEVKKHGKPVMICVSPEMFELLNLNN